MTIDTVVPKLGEMLVARNAISRAQLDAAIARQKTDRRPLGEILVESKLVSAQQLRRSLSWQHWLRQAATVASLSMVTWQVVEADDTLATAVADVNVVETRQQSMDIWDAAEAMDASPNYSTEVKTQSRKSRHKWEATMKDAIGEPAYILLKGRYSGNADGIIEGLRYTVRWKTDSVNVEFKYTF